MFAVSRSPLSGNHPRRPAQVAPARHLPGNAPGRPATFLPAPDRPAIAGSSLIATPQGPRPAQDLVPGDVVLSRDHGAVRVRALRIGRLSEADLRGDGRGAPIRIEPAALPWSGLSEALLLAPGQHLLHADPAAAADCLVPARALCNGGTVRRVIPEDGIAYVELDCERPCLLDAGGLWIEAGEIAGMRRGLVPAAPSPRDDTRVFRPL